MDKFQSFLIELKQCGADEALIESIMDAHNVIFYEGMFDQAKELLFKTPDPNVLSEIKNNPALLLTLDKSKWKIYADAFIDSVGKWFARLSYGLGSDVTPFYYWHEGLYNFTISRINELLNGLYYIKKNGWTQQTAYLDRLMGELESFKDSQKDKHQEYVSGAGSKSSLQGHDPIVHMNNLIDSNYGKQTKLRFKDLANRVGYTTV